MASQSKDQADIHEEAKNRFEDVWAATHDQCELAMQDRRFLVVAGAQYDGNLGDQYEDRPKPEINKSKQAQRKIMGEYRKNPITADFISKDGTENEELASQLDGAYRSDEQDCGGQEAYDCCADEAFAGGYGAYRYRTVDEDEFDPENEHQRIVWDYIPDADVSVHFDMNSKKQDKSDAEWGGVIHAMTREAYKDEYGDDFASWPRDINSDNWDWLTADVVYVFEYYRVEFGSRNVRVYESLTGEEVKVFEEDFEEHPERELELIATGHEHLKDRDRKIRTKEVHKYILSGARILEDCGRIAGNVIPIVPQYGERYIVNGVERYNGIIRTLKDAQRIYNMLIGLLSEIAVNGTKELPIFAPSQMPQPLREMWANANREQFSFLLAEPLKDADGNITSAGPMSFTKAPEVPPALAALIGVVGADIKDLLGEAQAPDEVVSNISGKAVELIQQMQDLPNYIFLDNARKARKRGVEIWLDMAKEVYIETGRLLRTVGSEGEIGQINIGRPKFSEDGELEFEFDLDNANVGVYADVGPASVSKKASAARDFLAALPLVAQGSEESTILLASAMMNMEGEGMQEMRPFWRNKLLSIGALEPTKEEAQEMQEAAQAQDQQPPNAQDQFLLSEGEKSMALAEKAKADTTLTLAKVEETQAKTVETLAGIDRDDQDQAIEAAQAIGNAVAAQPPQNG